MSYLDEVPHFKSKTPEEMEAAAEAAGNWFDRKTGEPLTEEDARSRVVSAKSVTNASGKRLRAKIKKGAKK